jgi:hypothetical protein
MSVFLAACMASQCRLMRTRAVQAMQRTRQLRLITSRPSLLVPPLKPCSRQAAWFAPDAKLAGFRTKRLATRTRHKARLPERGVRGIERFALQPRHKRLAFGAPQACRPSPVLQVQSTALTCPRQQGWRSQHKKVGHRALCLAIGAWAINESGPCAAQPRLCALWAEYLCLAGYINVPKHGSLQLAHALLECALSFYRGELPISLPEDDKLIHLILI